MTEKISENDKWDLKEILLTHLGGLITALTIAIVSFFGSKYLGEKQTIASNFQLYAQVMSSRENSDSLLRQEMFKTALAAFLSGKDSDKSAKEKLLQLELLAYNFHNALDLGPLFEYLYKDFSDDPDSQKRLESLSRNIKEKQIALLEVSGAKKNANMVAMNPSELNENPDRATVIEKNLALKRPGSERIFKVEVLAQDKKKLMIRLRAWYIDKRIDVDVTFWVGLFDFPTIRNIRLSNGDRCAITILMYYSAEDCEQSFDAAEMSLIYFPSSRASLKEKPYYDEITRQLLVENDYRPDK